jgi:hypothetical protein
MSDITVTVTDAGTGVPSVNVVDGSTFSTTVGSGGSVNVAIGDVTSGNATIVSGTLTVNSTTTLAAGSSAYAKNVGSAYAAAIDFGIPAGPATNIVVGNTTTLSAGSNASVTGTTSSGNLTLAFGIPRGATGATGSTGQNGVTPNIAIGNVSTLAAGSSATVAATPSNNGANVTLAFGLPRGATPSVSVGNVSTLAAGNSATVAGTSSNNGANLTLDFGIPAGVTPSFAVGNVSTVSAGGSATVTAKSSNGGANVTLDFGIPRGADGSGGSNVTLSDATPSNLGAASAGTSSLASRSDHTHNLPVIAYANLTGTPSNFPSNIGSVSGLQAALDAKQAAGNYVSSVNNLSGNLTLAAGSNVNLSTAGSVLTISANTPTIAYANLTGVPLNFPSNIASVLGLQSALDGKQAAGNYLTTAVTGVNNLTGNLSLIAAGGLSIAANGSTLTLTASADVANSTIDGGDYVGQLLYGITFNTQPQSVTANTTTSVNLTTVSTTGNVPTSAAFAFPGGLAGVRYATTASEFAGTWIANVATVVSANNGNSWSAIKYETEFSVNSTRAVSYNSSADDFPAMAASDGTRTVVAGVAVIYSDNPTAGNSWNTTAFTFYNGSRFQPYSVAHNGQKFAVVTFNEYSSITADGVYNLQLYSSSDGASWTSRTLPSISATFSSCRKALCAVNGTFVVPGVDQTVTSGVTTWYPKLFTSTDGVNWTGTQFSSSVTQNSTPVVFNDLASSGMIAVGVVGTTARYSTDGTTWGTATLPVSCNRVSWAAGRFWAFNSASSGTDVCYSVNGQTWTLGTMPVSAKWQSMAGDTVGFAASNPSGYYARATIGTTYATANLTVSATATGGGSVAYQWQSSLDAGTTWSDINGATNTTLSLSNLTTANSGTRYRAVASSTGAALGYSQSATLTVTG